TSPGGTCGMSLRNIGEGRGELTLFFDRSTSRETQQVFTEYIHLYLSRRALPESFNVRHGLACDTCGTVVTENQLQRRKAWKPDADWLPCNVCEAHVSLAEHEQQGRATPSPRTKEMDQAADNQREHEAAQLTLQGRIATNDFDVFLCHCAR